ncbi:DNA topoisomerase IB [Usitatibacter palustris]|uniref:DNA topoisomerase n=1 Tax=Usitatibacter palustris TaxID=2732487 RepID=A0A6M4H7W6_9PROT|nr:DNA topoisomerase IB [Usitatibacter palustris]QJR15462.1 hypothetical protein DSM104440_02283 [Usitatibacter palustris]
MTTPSTPLRFSSDAQPGYARIRRGERFAYRDSRGRAVRDAEAILRIRSLAIPPAWTDVWISPDERGHLQATGRDARGRKQYRYHPHYRAEREAGKFSHLREFGEALPAIRAQVRADLARDGMPREKVLAILVQLLERTAIRVGSEKYVRANDSFGLTTFRNKHVKVRGPRIEFDFRGKGGKAHRIAIDDPRLAQLVRRCRDLPGYELFQYVDESGVRRSIGSDDVNEYLRDISGAEITAKVFRTWIGSVCAACALARAPDPLARAALTGAIERASALLGNTPTICRKSYIHPSVLVPADWVPRLPARRKRHPGLSADEALLMNALAIAEESAKPRKPKARNYKASRRRSAEPARA